MLTLTSRSTQKKKTDSDRVLYYRTEEDVINLISYILYGGSTKPIAVGKSGFFTQQNTPNSICNEIFAVQSFYKKCNGIRVRHQIVNIDIPSLISGQEVLQARRIAEMFSMYYLFRGFQNVWSVSCSGDVFTISIAINTVSIFDGSKYQYNKGDIYDEEYGFLYAIVENVVRSRPLDKSMDYRKLDFYPYSF